MASYLRQLSELTTDRFWPVAVLREKQLWVECSRSRLTAVDPELPFDKQYLGPPSRNLSHELSYTAQRLGLPEHKEQ